MSRGFELVCEIESPVTPDMAVVREQIALLGSSCDAFLVPDSNLGRATVSSLAVAREVDALRGRAIACINARDRNLLGFRRDLLTARAYGLRELLFVHGDEPRVGERSTLTVRRMLEEVTPPDGGRPFDVGVTADVTRRLPAWKRDADVVFTQLTFDEQAVARWREHAGDVAKVFAGVVVLASATMARRLTDLIPGFEVPAAVMRDLERGIDVGVDVAVEQLGRLRESGAVDGVHLVPARRHRDTAQALQRLER